MAITAKIEYQPQLDPTIFVLADLTPYAAPDDKANISSRTLTLLDAYNMPLPGYANPINFPIGGINPDTFTIAALTSDMAFTCIMVLTPVTPQSGSVYTSTINFATNRFLQQGVFDIQVAQNNGGNVSTQAIAVYRTNTIDLIIEQQNSQTALLFGDFTGSQNELNKGEQIIANTTL